MSSKANLTRDTSDRTRRLSFGNFKKELRYIENVFVNILVWWKIHIINTYKHILYKHIYTYLYVK